MLLFTFKKYRRHVSINARPQDVNFNNSKPKHTLIHVTEILGFIRNEIFVLEEVSLYILNCTNFVPWLVIYHIIKIQSKLYIMPNTVIIFVHNGKLHCFKYLMSLTFMYTVIYQNITISVIHFIYLSVQVLFSVEVFH